MPSEPQPFPSRFATALAEGRAQTLVASGDSLTFGFLVGTGYLARVEAALCARFPLSPLQVRNEGVCGATAQDGLRRFEHDVAPAAADLLLIQYGLNDAFQRVPLGAFVCALEQLIARQRALNPQGEVLLVPPPIMAVPAEERVGRPFREALIEVGRRTDALVAPVVGRWPEGAAHLFLADRVHPTEAGHQIMADAVLAALVGQA